MTRTTIVFLGTLLAVAPATAQDPSRADAAQVDDYAAFLRDSGYESHLEEREGRSFPACH